jgi:hypothetical protein
MHELLLLPARTWSARSSSIPPAVHIYVRPLKTGTKEMYLTQVVGRLFVSWKLPHKGVVKAHVLQFQQLCCCLWSDCRIT